MAQKRRTPWVWLIVAAVLLAGGAWLMRGAEPPSRPPPPPVRLPTRMNSDEHLRADNRRTWVPVVMSDAGVVSAPPPAKDPVLALMPGEVKRAAVVAEFNAIVNSELGALMTECLFGDESDFLGELRDAGMDPLQKIDRVAMIDDSMVVTGDFKNAQWKKFLPENSVGKGYGKQGEVVEVAREDGGMQTFAVWGGQMFIAGGSEASQKAILDRLEGNGPQVTPVLDDSMAYGEVYGVINSGMLADLIGKQDARLGETIRQSAKSVQLHMDVSHDVGLVADIGSGDPQKTEELRRTIGSALSLARMQAQAKGKTEEADLLDLAKVRSAEGGSDFRLEAGLPYEYMEKAFRECIAERKKRAVEGDGAR
jgi:hypothetical protein